MRRMAGSLVPAAGRRPLNLSRYNPQSILASSLPEAFPGLFSSLKAGGLASTILETLEPALTRPLLFILAFLTISNPG